MGHHCTTLSDHQAWPREERNPVWVPCKHNVDLRQLLKLITNVLTCFLGAYSTSKCTFGHKWLYVLKWTYCTVNVCVAQRSLQTTFCRESRGCKRTNTFSGFLDLPSSSEMNSGLHRVQFVHAEQRGVKPSSVCLCACAGNHSVYDQLHSVGRIWPMVICCG